MQAYHDDMLESEANLKAKESFGFDPSTQPRDRLYAGKEKVKLVRLYEDFIAFSDSFILCKFYAYRSSDTNVVDLFSSVTGWKMTAKEFMQAGERVFNLCRAFNVREGFSRKDDALPKRLTEALNEGPYKGESIPQHLLDQMLDNYYELRGWNVNTGIPERTKLEELGLGYVANALEL